MKVLVSPNPFRDKTFRHTRHVLSVLKQVGIETVLGLPFGIDRSFDLPKDLKFLDVRKEVASCDILICLGGDGTILHAAKTVVGYSVPILAINFGTMGFMAELEVSDIPLLTKLSTGDFTLESRMMLNIQVKSGGATVMTDTALNDAVITKGAVARVIQMSVDCDGAQAMSFAGDGLIVATPTGSTAYSMSAGGPIVEPSARNLIITPICAHTFQAKCMVMSPDRCLTVHIGKIGKRCAFLSVDGGRAFRVSDGDVVEVRQSELDIKLVRLKPMNYFGNIHTKFSSR